MTTARNAAGRYTTRPAHPTCASCGSHLQEALDGALRCLTRRCDLNRQIVGNSGADVGALAVAS